MIERFDGPELTNPRAERVKAVRALSKRSIRARARQFRVEGPQGVREAIDYHLSATQHGVPGPVRELYLTEAFAARYAEIVGRAQEGSVTIRLASEEVLASMGETPSDQGVVAVCAQIDCSLDAIVDARPRLVAVLSQVRDPGNAGTILRAADAAGADAVIFTDESVDVYNPKVVRSTAGSLFHVPVVLDTPLADITAALRDAGLALLAADGSGDAELDTSLDDVDRFRYLDTPIPAGKPNMAAATAWVFGNEAWGLRDHDRAMCDYAVRIPIHGRAESLNLGTAAAVCLYASARAQRLHLDSTESTS